MKLARLGAVCAFAVSLISTPSHAELRDRGGGMIYDTKLKITWAQERAQLQMEWEEAQDWVAALRLGGVGGWRLPYISVAQGAGPFVGTPVDCSVADERDCRDNEVGYMFYQNLGGTMGLPIPPNGDPDVLDLFPSLIALPYWTGTAVDLTDAWNFNFFNGEADANNPQQSDHYVWAVHDGDVGCQSPCPDPDPDIDYPEIADTIYSVHNVSQIKLKECATDGVNGKIKCTNIKAKDVETLLCGNEAGKDEKLAIYSPCPMTQILDEDFEGAIGNFLFLGVFNFETGRNACTIEPIGIDLESSAQVYVKDGKIKQIQTRIAGEITPYDYIASATADFKEVKNTDTLLDGFNCVSKIRTKSLVGEKFGVVNSAVIESGKIKAGKAKDAITGVEIVEEICGIDCEL